MDAIETVKKIASINKTACQTKAATAEMSVDREMKNMRHLQRIAQMRSVSDQEEAAFSKPLRTSLMHFVRTDADNFVLVGIWPPRKKTFEFHRLPSNVLFTSEAWDVSVRDS